MNKRFALLLFFCLASILQTWSQSGPNAFYFQHYQYNPSIVNPSLTAHEGGNITFMGSFNNNHHGSNYRGGLIALERPSSNNRNAFGLLAYSNNHYGNINRSLGGSFRRRFDLSNDVSLYLGARLNIHQSVYGNLNRVYTNIETGAAIHAKNFYGGLNVFDVLSSGKVIFYNRVNQHREDGRPQFNNRYWMLNLGYKLGINDFVSTDYNLVFRASNGISGVDFHNNFLFGKSVFAGFSILNLHNFDAVDFAINAGVRVQNTFQFGVLCYSARRYQHFSFPTGDIYLKIFI